MRSHSSSWNEEKTENTFVLAALGPIPIYISQGSALAGCLCSSMCFLKKV